MARRGDDVIGFTRIFVMFVTLVIVPSLFMSGFGVIAILNVQEVELQRRRERAETALRHAEARFVNILQTADSSVAAGLLSRATPSQVIDTARAAGAPIGAWVLLDDEGKVVEGTPPLSNVSSAQLSRLTPRDASHVAVDDVAYTGTVSIVRGRGVLAYAIDDDLLARRMEGAGNDAGLVVTFRSDKKRDEALGNALARVVGELVSDEPGKETVLTRRLEVPFQRYTFIVQAPPSTTTTTVTIIYIVLLALFLATLIAGVVITGRLIYQETRLSRLKTDFVSHMSHELRTPLTSIRLFIETLKLGRTSSKEEEQECLDLLAKETERLSEMIERVLGYARLKAGRRVFTQEDVDVEQIINDAIDAFRAQTLADGTDERQLAFTTEVVSGLSKIRADREALVEALLNLISNAYKYTGPDKRIVVFARIARRGKIVIGVKDNGPGLPKAEHARIFERFYQAKHLLSGKQPGSGLGLAITKAIIEGQGGTIDVESEPGKGSTFSMTFAPV